MNHQIISQDMEKKEYITPIMESMDISPVDMMASSVFVSDETTDADANMSNDRRGGWGSLWD